jgi:hypothetical protein
MKKSLTDKSIAEHTVMIRGIPIHLDPDEVSEEIFKICRKAFNK